MKRLGKYFKGLYLRALTAPLFKFIEATFELFVPICMKIIIDEGIKGNDKPLIFRMCGVLALLALFGLAFAFSAQYFSASVATTFSARIRSALFKHVQYLSFSDGDKIGKGTLIARLTSDILRVQTAVNLTLRLVLRSPFIVAGSIVMAFTVSPDSLPIFLITVAVIFLLIFLIMYVTLPKFKKVQSSLDKLILRTKENASAARVVRAFNRVDYEEKRYSDAQDDLYSDSMSSSFISSVLSPASFVIINAALLFIILLGGDKVNTGSLTAGDVVALVNYMSSILVELVKTSNFIITLNKGIVSGNRIADILSTESEEATLDMGEVLSHTAHSVEFKNVYYRYPGASGYAIENVSFKINAGETLGIIGGTGSGKSTIAALIPGYIKPTEGEILIDGVPADTFSARSRRADTAYVSQSPAVFSGSMEYNVRFGNPDATKEDVDRAVALSCADEFILKKEGGLSFVAQQRGSNLSGGQCQRLNVARAFARKAGILILDDASSALDNATDKKLRRAIATEMTDTTKVIIAQRCGSVSASDLILVLDNGKCAGLGTHNELMSSCESYKKISDLQYGEDGKEA